ncbi:MAG: type II secretion system F family protein [Candidatus Micrarchaeota archaeon]
MLEEFAKDLASFCDFSIYFPNYDYALLQQDLAQADIEISPRDWLSFSAIISCFLSAASFFCLFFLTLNWGMSVLLFPLMLALSLFCFLNLPAYIKHKRAEEIEKELSIALRTIIVQLNLDLPFERIIENAALAKFGKLSKEMRRAHLQIENGSAGVAEALESLAIRVDSQFVRRAIAQLIFSYEHGLESSALSKIADEMILNQKTKSTEFASKMAFLGLLFIAVSCIIPALFAAYVIIGSSFLSLSITANDVYTAYLLLFPLSSTAVLLYIKEKSPAILNS